MTLNAAAGHYAEWAEDPEEALIERARSDPEAIGVLYERHRQAIGDYLYRRTGDSHLAEDLLAEVFLSAVRHLPRYRARKIPFRHWLYRIATNSVNRWARRARLEGPMETLPEEPVALQQDGRRTMDPRAGTVRSTLMTLAPRT